MASVTFSSISYSWSQPIQLSHMKYSVSVCFPGEVGTAKSSLVLAALPRLTRLMASRELALGSPTTSHQPSSLRPGKRGAWVAGCSVPSCSRSNATTTATCSPAITSGPELSSKLNCTSGYLLHTAATSVSCCSLMPSSSRRWASSRSITSNTLLAPAAVHLAASSLVKCGSCSSGESLSHIACTTIWLISMATKAGESHPELATTSTTACSRRTASGTTAR
mmetsp:Transcript_19852/g.55359  ORF Transcript_19852/g.55359 Transcript_19852/m.55359 type:complete len:222 (-) Transcript_19852:5961-6626(-)